MPVAGGHRRVEFGGETTCRGGVPVTIIGIDAHKRTHTMVAIDGTGAPLGEKTVSAIPSGHAEALRWAAGLCDTDVLWAVEDARLYTRLLEHDLLAARQRVVRVPTVLMSHTRKSARTWGKSDPIDATAVARAALREPDLPVAFHDPVSWELQLLIDRRDDLVAQRVAVTNRLLQRLHLIDPTASEPKNLARTVQREALDDYLRGVKGLCSELAREELSDIDRFSRNIDTLTKSICGRVRDIGSSLPEVVGCGELTAARFICGAANVTRFRTESAFARYVGVAPQPEWSGSTRGRLRLSRSGNRGLNSALHTIAIVQIRLDGPGRAYYQRRIESGDTKAGARRCLKRRICRVVFTRLMADYRAANRLPAE
jgi:transposase